MTGYVLRDIVCEELLPPSNRRYPGNAKRRLTLSCGHHVVRSHVSARNERTRCEWCEDLAKDVRL